MDAVEFLSNYQLHATCKHEYECDSHERIRVCQKIETNSILMNFKSKN